MPPKAAKSDNKASASANDNDKVSFLTEHELRILAQCILSTNNNIGNIKPNYPKAGAELGLAAGTVKNAWGVIKQKITAEKAKTGAPAASAANNDDDKDSEDANPTPKKRARTAKTAPAAAAAKRPRGRPAAQQPAPLLSGRIRLSVKSQPKKNDAEKEKEVGEDSGDEEAENSGNTTVDEDEAGEPGVV